LVIIVIMLIQGVYGVHTWEITKLVGVAKKLAASGYGVFAMDYLGLGLSKGLHCYIPCFDRLVDDVIEHYSKIKGV
jgi:dienelactone hydrolase